jgi:enamine deaminase RidA (YjgF/YER057c/UK114 family)
MRRIAIAFLFASLGLALGQAQTGRQVIRTDAPSGLPFSPGVRAGDFIYLAGALAPDSVGASDIKGQTKAVLDTLGTVLKAAGVGFENVVSTTVYLKNGADASGMNEVYAARWPKDPPARTTVVVDGFARPTALVEINAIAVRNGVGRKAIRPSGWGAPPEPFSYAIQAGDTLFISGFAARDAAGQRPVGGDMKAQATNVMERHRTVLAAAGMAFSDVAMGRVWITDAKLFGDMNAVYRAAYQKDLPARATLIAQFPAAEDILKVSLIAVKGPARNAVAAVPAEDGSAGKPNPNYSAGVGVGNRFFVTGTLGNMPSNAGDMRAQTRETLARMGRVLKAGGFGIADVVDVNVYVTDIAKFEEMNAAYREVFAKDFPARTTVQVGNVTSDGIVEIVMTAAR